MKKANKIVKNYRLKPTLVEKIESASANINCSNTSIIEQSLTMFFDAYDKQNLNRT